MGVGKSSHAARLAMAQAAAKREEDTVLANLEAQGLSGQWRQQFKRLFLW